MFVVKQKTAYVMRISDWSSDVCFSDLCSESVQTLLGQQRIAEHTGQMCDPGQGRQFGADAVQQLRDRGLVADIGGEGVDAALVELGRGSCRERECPYVSSPVVAVPVKKKDKCNQYETMTTEKQP